MSREQITPAVSAVKGGGWRDLAIVAALALVVRLTFYFINSRTNPAFDYLIMDSMHIDRWARAIAAGEAGPAVYFRGPLYPYVLAAVYKISGGSNAAAVLFNHVCGTLTSVLVALLAREYFPRRTALVAGIVAALYWPLIYFEGEILVESLFIMLLVLALWRLARAAAVPSIARVLAAGVCLGLAALARPTALILLAMVPFVFRLGVASRGAWLRWSGLFAVAFAVILLPATLHNYRGSGALVPVAWSGGLNLYIGNNDQADGRSAFIPGALGAWMGGEDEALTIARDQSGRPLSPAEASSFYADRALEFIGTRPVSALRLTLKKAAMFWEGPELSNEKYIYFFWGRYGLGRAPMPGFWIVGPFALVGLVGLWRRRRELALLYLSLLAYMLAVVAFFVVARLRLPVAPLLIIFAAWTAVDTVSVVRARNRSRIILRSVLLVAAVLLVNAGYPEFVNQRPTHDVISHYLLAGAYVEKNDNEAALVELARARVAFEAAPSRQYVRTAQDIYMKLGTLLYERGRCREAADALGRVLPNDPRAGAARAMFADCCERTGRFEEAAKAYEMILAASPGDVKAQEGLIRCLEALGRYDDAARARERFGR